MLGSNQRIWGYETNFGGLADLSVVKANQLMPGSYIIAGARTPIGKMSGALASFSAADLGGFATCNHLVCQIDGVQTRQTHFVDVHAWHTHGNASF